MPKPQPNLFALARQRQQDIPIDLQIMAAKLPRAEPEYPFAATLGRNWRADRAWPEYRILFEIEGGGFGNVFKAGKGTTTTRKKNGERVRVEVEEGTLIRVGGRHSTGAGMANDIEKYNAATLLGWMVIRATPDQIRDGYAIDCLERAFAERRKQGFPK